MMNQQMQVLSSNSEIDDMELHTLQQPRNKKKCPQWYLIFLGFFCFVLIVVFYRYSIAKQSNIKQIPITYIWIGDKIPSSYVCLFQNIDYPHQIIFNPQIILKFDRQLKVTQISDLSKLQHIYYHGGLVSDFDNEINYDCLMQLLNDKKGLYVTAEAEDILSSFYYASEPFNPDMKRVLDGISDKNFMQKFAGSPVIKDNNISRININQCVKHKRDWSWRKDEGQKDEYSGNWRADWNSKLKCTLKNPL